jgi:ABC-type sugar transport system substrate-binding protein
MQKFKNGLMGIALIALIAMIAFTGCSKKEVASQGGPKKYVVGVLLKDLSNTFVKIIGDSINARAAELSNEVTLVVQDARGSISTAIQQAEDMITQRVDALILNPQDYEGCAPIVDMALEANIPIVVVNATTNNTNKVSYVGSDDVDAGRIQSEFLKTKLKPGARVTYLMGPIGISAQIERKEGIYKYLFNDPEWKINILAEQTANWRTDEAMTLSENWLTAYNNDIAAIICQNDEMAMGALEATEAKGVKNEIVIIGIDAIASAVAAVKAGRLDATVFQDGSGQGRESLNMALELIKTGQKKIPDRWIPFVLVTQDNADQFM